MSDSTLKEARQSWNLLAEDWRVQVGADGDSNRRLNSDPVLWEFAGDVRGLAVLDAGCGTGYLSAKLRDRGALVTGVDFAERMIEIARADYPGNDFRVDSCTELATCEDGQFDLVIANYVLMDTSDLAATVRAFARVLKPGGVAVLVFSPPASRRGVRPCRRTAGRSATAGTSRTSSRGSAWTRPGGTSRPSSSGSTGRCRTTGRRSPPWGSPSWASRSPGHTGPLPPRREREETPEQQDTALLGRLQTAQDSPDGIT
jgi:SAM-dependent methyltransferase